LMACASKVPRLGEGFELFGLHHSSKWQVG
jgi:hypothetical protein